MVVVDVPMYEHQQRAVAFLRECGGKAGLFMEMGLGKSRVALVHVAEQECDKILIICPLSVVGVWKREIGIVGLDVPVFDLTTEVGVATRAKKLKKAPRAIVLLNYESYWRKPLKEAIMAWAPEALVFDEAQRLRGRTTHQSRFAHSLGARESARVRLALTGTPIANGLEDAWSIYRFIDHTTFGNWTDFKERYLRFGGYLGKQIVGYRNVEEANAILARTAFQCTKEEALDLPERQDILIPVELSPNSRRIYDELKKKAVVDLRTAFGGGLVVARTMLTMILRLQQITGGFARDDVTGELFDVGTEKADTTRELIETAHSEGKRVVVFARFIHDLDLIQKTLAKDNLRVARLDGSVPSAARGVLIEAFREGKFDVLISQLKVGSLGIDLTAACVGIFYSTGYSLDDFFQARDRLHRIGQTQKVTYYHLTAARTVDEQVIRALMSKTAIARAATNLSYALKFIQG